MSARLLLLFATASVLNCAWADPASPNSTKGSTTISAADLAVSLKYRLAPNEFDSVRGAYTLSDGRRLKVWTEQHKLFAEMNFRTFEIQPESEHTFVSVDGTIRLRFQPEALAPAVTVSEK